MSEAKLQVARRHLLVVGSGAVAAACAPSVDTATRLGLASPSEPVPDAGAVTDADDPFVDLDGGLAAPRSLGWRSPCGGVDVGDVSDLAVGTWRLNAGARVVVSRDAAGVFAYSAICTHERCLLGEPDAQGVTECGCHHSRFDGAGRVIQGPAVADLRPVAVAVLGGRMCVDATTRVTPATRAAIPDPDAGVGDAASDAQTDGAVDAGPRDEGAVDAGPVDAGPVDAGDPCLRGADVGPLTTFAAGTWTYLRRSGPSDGVIVGRDARGLFAYSIACTHQGCAITTPDGDGLTSCNCHGSRFDGDGRVTRGPASEDLTHYAVHVCAGRVRVDRGEVVDVSARAPAS